MVHQGTLPSGSPVTITLALDRGASGPASLYVDALRERGQPPAHDGAHVAPGEAASVVLALFAPGRLKIVVDVAAERDAAMLTVTTGVGLVRDRAPTVGDTVWVYAVN